MVAVTFEETELEPRGDVVAEDFASADLLNLPPLPPPEELESSNNPSNLEDAETGFSTSGFLGLSEGSRTFSGKLSLGPNWSRLQSFISEAENEPLDLEAMASEPSSVFKRFDYTEDWEEQIQEYIELVQSCEVEEVTVQDNRGLVLTFPGDVGNVSPSDFPLIVRYEDPAKAMAVSGGRSKGLPREPAGSRRRASAAFTWAAWEEDEPAVPERRTQTPKMKSPESSHSQNWDQLAALMDHADVPLASAEGSPEPPGSSPFAASTPQSPGSEERSLSNTLGSMHWLEDSVLPRKVKLNLRKLRYDPGAQVKTLPPASFEMRSTMFPASPKIAKADGEESVLGALRRVRKKRFNFPDADEVKSMRGWHESEERVKSSWREHSLSAPVPFLDLVPVIGGEACGGRNRAANMPFGHITKPRFHYTEFEESRHQIQDPQAHPDGRRKTQPVRPGTRMIGKMRSPLVQIKEDFMSITAITSFHRLCKVQR